jgi:hypothetical protein
VLEGSAKKGNWKRRTGEEVDRNKCIAKKKSGNLKHEYFQSCSYIPKLSYFCISPLSFKYNIPFMTVILVFMVGAK